MDSSLVFRTHHFLQIITLNVLVRLVNIITEYFEQTGFVNCWTVSVYRHFKVFYR
jgi:hypothetical protein